ncbi:MAG: hypothetical protein QS98_C0014G0038 [archaeon GW2011_AR3]|nr:MAG: hypothetical protein QS98_C0014G0038 [archaeon GW2011_AR3]MBS3109241.1 hypothetical protein [Candidatus Woesearchaeota archaeon]
MRTAKQLAQDPAMMQDISRFDTMHLDLVSYLEDDMPDMGMEDEIEAR